MTLSFKGVSENLFVWFEIVIKLEVQNLAVQTITASIPAALPQLIRLPALQENKNFTQVLCNTQITNCFQAHTN